MDVSTPLTFARMKPLRRWGTRFTALVLLGLTGCSAAGARMWVQGAVADPDVAVVLLVVGALLIYLEFNVPGTVVSGATGTLLFFAGRIGTLRDAGAALGGFSAGGGVRADGFGVSAAGAGGAGGGLGRWR